MLPINVFIHFSTKMSCLSQIESKESMFLIFLFAGTLLSPVTSGTESSVSLTETTLPSIVNNQGDDGTLECHKICGCDRAYIYDETKKECVLDNSYILQTTLARSSEDRSVTNYNQDHDMANDEGMAKQIFIEAEKFFRSIIISALLFAGCASICVLSASFYCCHINYSDRKMERELKALAKKLNTKYHSKKSIRRSPLEPIEESCNVVVEDAGVFVV